LFPKGEADRIGTSDRSTEMRNLNCFLSLCFFVCYLVVQCSLGVRSILSEVRRPYGFGMYNSKGFALSPYRIVRADGSREVFRIRRGVRSLSFASEEGDTVLVYPTASRPQWDPRLACVAHTEDAIAIEWSEAGFPKRFDCPG
jgi:hypothetical protein